MPGCPSSSLQFSDTYAMKRTARAKTALGADVVNRLLAFALFLLGARRESIAECLEIPLGTLLSFLTRMSSDGLPALEDRRAARPTPGRQDKPTSPQEFSISVEDDKVAVSLGTDPNCKWMLPQDNVLQCKTVLLSLMNSDLVSTKAVSEAIGLSSRRIRDLGAGLQEQDVLALLDKRTGQRSDYRVTPEVKAELIQQFAVNAISGESTSSCALVKDLQKRCGLKLSDRSIRLHIMKLGLAGIASSLPDLIKALKKTPRD